MRLAIIIPALDEEESIRAIIERSLAAREEIEKAPGVSGVDITVVSDGSTDRTGAIAREYTDRIALIEFEHNRGYGAAIMAGWAASRAELLGFLDADGTCDPRFFAELCRALDEEQADIAIGCRLHPASRMPLVRRIGNRLFAAMLSMLSLSQVRDVASGMRVVRRSALRALYPLPTGLNFTPAMSTRAILSGDLKIVERDMPYDERSGTSKLNVLHDGWRFLRVILQTSFLYRPNRPLGFLAVALIALCVVMMVYPSLFYLRNGRLEEWMIYRFLVSVLLSSVAILMVCAGHLARKATDISLAADPMRARHASSFGRLIRHRWFWILPPVLVAAGVALVWDAWSEYVRTGKVYEHWSRFVVMMFFLTLSAILLATKFLDHCLDLLAERLAYLRGPSARAVEASGRADPEDDA